MKQNFVRLAWTGTVLFSASLYAGEINLIRNGDFKNGLTGWSDADSNEEREIKTVDAPEGGKALFLKRIKQDAKVQIAQFNLRFKPRMLYKLTATGWGKAPAGMALRPSSSKDGEYFNLCKSWATSSAPFVVSDKPVVQTFIFDSGLKADSAFVSLYLRDGAPGEFYISGVSLVEIGDLAPSKEEVVIAHLGDSVTITSYLPFTQRVDVVLQAMIEKSFPGRRVRQINLGVDGEFIGELLETKRYDKAIKEQYEKIDIVVIRYGANDQRKYPADRFKELLGTLCSNLEKDYPGISIVIGTGPYIYGSDYANKEQYGSYWQASRDFAKEKKYVLVDVYKRLEKEANVKTAIAQGDSHPSAYGVTLVAEVEFEALKSILSKKP